MLNEIIDMLKQAPKPQMKQQALAGQEKYRKIQKEINENIYELYRNPDADIKSLFIELVFDSGIDVETIKRFFAGEETSEETKRQIINFVNQCINRKINEQEEVLNTKGNIEQLIETLEDMEKNQNIIDGLFAAKIIGTLNGIFKGLTNEQLSKIADAIIEYNNSLANRKRKTESVDGLTDEQIQILCDEYDCDISESPIGKDEMIKQCNFDNVVEIINWLEENDIQLDITKRQYCYLLIASNVYTLDEVKKLSQEYKFDFEELIRKLPAAFISRKKAVYTKLVDEKKVHIDGNFNYFQENIKTISRLGCDVSSLSSVSVYSSPPETINHNIAVLSAYGYTNLAEINFYLNALKANNIQMDLDRLIEMGKLEDIMNGKTSYIINKFNKIANDYLASQEINPDEENFVHFIFDEKTDSEIYKTIEEIARTVTPSDYTDEKIGELEQFRNSERTYLFSKDNQSALISSMKVKTIYPILLQAYPELDRDKLLLFALTYKSILTDKQFEMIKEIILKEKTR